METTGPDDLMRALLIFVDLAEARISNPNQEFYLERRSDDDFADLYDVQFLGPVYND